MSDQAPETKDFIRTIVEEDIKNGKHNGSIVTRFPPEPNGYLHVGHAKAINLDFGIAQEYGGRCHLRFDDTNPAKEDEEYVNAIKEDVKWLGWDWGEHLYWASSYFQKMYDYAVLLIKDGKAYVDDQNADQIRENRGTLTEPGKESPYRNRPVEETLELFERMKNGEFPDGSKVLRAKIDMASANLNMRDPIMYRVLHKEHHNTGNDWCIYPMYDWAHGIEDAIEGVTHSLCTLEFENHRPLYDWFLEQIPGIHRPQQIEFGRLNLTYTVMSKRKLLQLVQENYVNGWDDPRMPTLSGMRRRGFTPEAIKAFCDTIGITKINGFSDIALLEHCQRDDLNKKAPRYMGVLNPVKVVIENYPDGQTEELEAVNSPEDPSLGTRQIPFSRELYIDRDDFMENPTRKYFRLAPGAEVRLRYAYLVTCTGVVKNDSGEITEIRCSYDPETRGGSAPDGRKVKGTIHWVSASHAVDAEIRLYDRLFTVENPDGNKETSFLEFLNPDSLESITAKVEPYVTGLSPETRFQFERIGYFCADRYDYSATTPVFNRIVPLRDSWKKIQQKNNDSGNTGNVPTDASPNQDGQNTLDLIDIKQFFKSKLLTAKVKNAERIDGADKLLKLQVEVGSETRQVVAGIAKWYAPEDLLGKTVVIVANLKPAKIFGIESNGMLLAAKSGKKKLTVITTDASDFESGCEVG